LGLNCKDGVVLVVEKPLVSKMLVPGSNRRIHNVGTNAGIALAGLLADGRQIINRARDECRSYKDSYDVAIPPNVLSERLSQYVHYFTLHGSLRPFGAAALIASVDPDNAAQGGALHMIEPSGISYRYFGCAVGKGRQGAKTEIEKLKLQDLSCREGLKEAAKILHTLHDGSKDKPFIMEASWLCQETGWKHQAVPADLITEADQWGKKAVEDADMDDDSDEEAK